MSNSKCFVQAWKTGLRVTYGGGDITENNQRALKMNVKFPKNVLNPDELSYTVNDGSIFSIGANTAENLAFKFCQ